MKKLLLVFAVFIVSCDNPDRYTTDECTSYNGMLVIDAKGTIYQLDHTSGCSYILNKIPSEDVDKLRQVLK